MFLQYEDFYECLIEQYIDCTESDEFYNCVRVRSLFEIIKNFKTLSSQSNFKFHKFQFALNLWKSTFFNKQNRISTPYTVRNIIQLEMDGIEVRYTQQIPMRIFGEYSKFFCQPRSLEYLQIDGGNNFKCSKDRKSVNFVECSNEDLFYYFRGTGSDSKIL